MYCSTTSRALLLPGGTAQGRAPHWPDSEVLPGLSLLWALFTVACDLEVLADGKISATATIGVVWRANHVLVRLSPGLKELLRQDIL